MLHSDHIDGPSRLDGGVEARETVTGTLLGIARHGRPRGPMETVRHVAVTRTEGIQGDFRGAVRPGKVPRRQVTLFEREAWDLAMAELGLAGDAVVPWWERRCNLLIDVRMPRRSGYVVAIGETLRIEITSECDPCSRMEEVARGLKAVLLPDWRGGFCGRVISDGQIAVGNPLRIEA